MNDFEKALLHRDWEVLLRAIPAAKDLNYHHGDSNTALMLAAAFCKPHIVDALIKAGANIHITNKEDNNALIFAAWNDDLESIKLLLQAGADINAKGSDGDTALMKAIEESHLDVVKLLMENNADIQIKNDRNRNAVELAKALKRQNIATYLEQFELDRIASVKNNNDNLSTL